MLKPTNNQKEEFERELEAERQRLYMVASQFSLTSNVVVKQSNVVDKYIITAMVEQLEQCTKRKPANTSVKKGV